MKIIGRSQTLSDETRFAIFFSPLHELNNQSVLFTILSSLYRKKKISSTNIQFKINCLTLIFLHSSRHYTNKAQFDLK